MQSSAIPHMLRVNITFDQDKPLNTCTVLQLQAIFFRLVILGFKYDPTANEETKNVRGEEKKKSV